MIINKDGRELQSGSVMYFDTTSIRLHTNINLFVVTQTSLTSLSATMRNDIEQDSEVLNLYEVSGQTIADTEIIDLANVQYSKSNNRHIYKINVKFSPDVYGDFSNQVIITYVEAGNTYTTLLNVQGTAVEQKDSLVVTMQNFKKFITDDYYTAFFETDWKEDKKDFELLNRKRKEFILEMFELTGFTGAYKSLLAQLQYFGYGELLTIKELWKGVNSDVEPAIKQTDILASVQTQLDKSLVSYTKTNLMRLVYQINQEEVSSNPPHVDGDNQPLYVNILYDTDKILIKLYALERILEKDFLPLNSKIVEISGEYQSLVGHEVTYWLKWSGISDYSLSENLLQDMTFAYEESSVQIKRHYIDTEAWSIEYDDAGTPGDLTDDIPGYIPGITTALFDKTFFEIENEYLRDSTDQVDLAKLYSGDFGIIQLNASFDASAFNRYQFILYKNDDTDGSYISPIRDISAIGDSILVGVRDVGTYRLVLYLYDNFGGATIVSIPDDMTIVNVATDFEIFQTTIEATIDEKRLDLLSTFASMDNTQYPIVEPLDWETLDVNTFDPDTSIFRAVGYYAKEYDMSSTYTQINNLSGIQIQKFAGTAIQAYGYKYGTLLIDVIGDNAVAGERGFYLKQYSVHANNYISSNFLPGAISEEEFLQALISQANNQVDNFYTKFTYAIEYLNLDDDINLPSVPMLRIIAKDIGNVVNKFYYSAIETGDAEVIDIDDGVVYFTLDSNLMCHYNGSIVAGDFAITLGETSYILLDASFIDIDDAMTKIQALLDSENLNIVLQKVEADYVNQADYILFSSRDNMKVSHGALGLNISETRGLPANSLKKIPFGSDVRLAEPLYAFISKESKLRNLDVNWVLKNSLTGDIVSEQSSYAFRAILLEPGAYDLELHSTDDYGINTRIRKGVFLVS